MHRLLVLMILVSCKQRNMCKDGAESNNPFVESLVIEKKVNSPYKELAIVFYQHLLEDEFLSTKEFTLLFGNLYDETDRYLKRQLNSEIEKNEVCFEISDDCISFIFTSMKQRFHEISYGYKIDEIQKVISNGEIEGNLLILTFPNNEIVTFYFKQIDGINSFNLIVSNIIAKDHSFLSQYEE